MQDAAKLGILMLDTTFKRIKGDIGNPSSFSFPVNYKVVSGATVNRVVKKQDPNLIDPFIEAAKRLEDDGVKAITTSCGFLALFQKEIGQAIEVPFFSSSLMQIPFVYSIVNGTIGIITARKASLTSNHLLAVNADKIPNLVYGMDDMDYFTSAIVEQTRELDSEKVSQEMVRKAVELKREHPNVKAIVLECTNMPPYREMIQNATQLPVFDIITMTNFVYRSLP